MNVFEERITLRTGYTIPKIGLGVWCIGDDKVSGIVKTAIGAGYRHIDTAQSYKNERGTGEGIRTSGIKREYLFVTSKMRAEYKDYASASASIDESLKTMGLDYLDLMIIHAPQPWKEMNQSDDRFLEGNLEAWRALEDAYKAGKLAQIGVSNFLEGDLDNILSNCTVKPAVDQILCHIGNTPLGLIDYCKDKGITVEAYSPIAHGVALRNADIASMAGKYEVSVPQLCVRYCWQLGLVVLPKASTPEHIRQNAEIDFEISEEDMETLKSVPVLKDYGEFGFYPVYGGKL